MAANGDVARGIEQTVWRIDPPLDGERLTVTGRLRAGGGSEPLHLVATLRPVGPELEIEARAQVDQRLLGMTYRLMGLVGAPTQLVVRGRLVPDS